LQAWSCLVWHEAGEVEIERQIIQPLWGNTRVLWFPFGHFWVLCSRSEDWGDLHYKAKIPNFGTGTVCLGSHMTAWSYAKYFVYSLFVF
jgi:hypothetical protein